MLGLSSVSFVTSADDTTRHIFGPFSRHVPDNDFALCVFAAGFSGRSQVFPSLQLVMADSGLFLGSGGRHQLLGHLSISCHDPMEFTEGVHTLEFSVIFPIRFRRLLLVSFVLCSHC